MTDFVIEVFCFVQTTTDYVGGAEKALVVRKKIKTPFVV